MLKDKKIFLTGGAGFIGTKLCSALHEDNSVLIYDNFKRNSIRWTGLLDSCNVRLAHGDVLDSECLRDTIGSFKPDIVVHLAAVAGIDTVIKNPADTMRVNMIGTYNLLEALRENLDDIERYVNISTSEVFGSYAFKVDEASTTNLQPVGEARWTYSVSKLAGEHLTHSYYKMYGLPAVTIRPFNIFGPGQVGEGAIHQFAVRAVNNEDMLIHGDGDQIRSWCYIDDFIDGLMLCLEKDEAVGNSFNIGNPRNTITISMLAQLIKTIAESDSRILYVPKDYTDVEIRMPSIEKAKKMLQYAPKWELTDGLRETIDWYRKVLFHG